MCASSIIFDFGTIIMINSSFESDQNNSVLSELLSRKYRLTSEIEDYVIFEMMKLI